MTDMTVVSVFTGIGGFDLGFTRAGFRVAAQVENDRYANRVLTARFPNVPRFGAVEDVDADDVRAAAGGRVDVVVGGFPCQDLSVAGRRTGLAGERSGLYPHLLRLAAGLDPDWLVIENVPGLLLAHDGADMARLLADLTGFHPAVPTGGWRNSGVCTGPHGTTAWRVLDAAGFGVPQRRPRVFVVHHPRHPTAAAEVLLEPGSVPGDPQPRGRRPEPHPGATQSRSGGPGVLRPLTPWDQQAQRVYDPAGVSPTLTGDIVLIHHEGRVRRLTPTECERLQGFPPGWTHVDTHRNFDKRRYTQAGNAVCVPVAEWVAARIAAFGEGSLAWPKPATVN